MANTRPQVRHGALGASYVENDAPMVVCDTIELADSDSSVLTGATVRISRGYEAGQDLLAYSGGGAIAASWDALTGTLTFSGTASLADYEAALRSVTFVHAGDDPQYRSRTVSFQVDDGTELSRASNVNFRFTAVNDAPDLTVNPALVYTTFQTPAPLDVTLALVDPDSDVRGASIVISGNYQRGEDVLTWVNSDHVRGSFDVRTGTLELRGRASAAEYEQVLRSVNYIDLLASPTLATRTLTIRVDDATGGASDTASITIDYAAPPHVTVGGAPLAYTEGDAAVTLEAALGLTDVDDPDMAGATVNISAGFHTGDSLVFANTANITGSYDSATGVLTLSGAATVAEYQAALRSIQFVSTSDDPGTGRTVTWVVNDGTDDSTPVTTTINVTPVNDAPALSMSATLAYTENDAAAAIAPAATVSDVDSADFNGGSLTVALTANGTAADQLTIVDQGTGAGQIGVSGSSITYGGATIGTFTGGASGSSLVVTFTSAAATQAAVQALVRDIAYANTSDNPSALARTVSFTVVDGDGGTDSSSATATVNFTAVNDAPTFTPGGTAAEYTEGGTAAAVDAALAVADLDDANLESATVSITGDFQAGDSLVFTDTAQITGSYNSGTGVLTLTGTATLAQYEAALRSVTFGTTNDDPAAGRTVTWVVNDGTDNSPAQTTTINIAAVNDAPVLSMSATLAYTENGPAAAIAPAATVADADSADFNGGSLTAAFTANGTSADELTIANQGTGAGQIGVSGANVTYGGVTIGTFTGGANGSDLVVTFTSAAATQAAAQALVRAIGYSNTSDDPSTLARTVGFTLVDGDGGTDTGTAGATVNVTAVNDAPTFTSGGSAASFTEGGAAAIVGAALVLADADDSNLESATVSITGNFQAGDSLVFTDTAQITGSYNSGTGVLTLTGTATLAQYQAALRTITFATTNDDPAAGRTVSWVVNDGTDNSAAQTTTIDVTPVNDAPVLSMSATLAYTENGPAAAIAPSATVSDVDSADFNGGSLTVAFSANGTSGDQLTIADQGTGAGQIGTSGTNITYGGTTIGTFTGGANGSDLVVTFTSAAATQAAVQALVRDIAYGNTSDNPSTLARTVDFTVVDGDGGSDSASASATVNVTAANDAPTATTSGGSTGYTEGTAPVAVDAAIAIADPDNATLASATVQITGGYLNGDDVLAFANTAGMGNISAAAFDAATGTLTLTSSGATATVAQWQAALAAVKFDTSSDSPGASRTISFQVNDGQGANNLSSVETKTIAITEVNSAPVVTATAGSAAFVENAAAVVVDSGITLADADTSTLAGATIQVTSNFNSAQDVLSFTPVGSITGSYNASTGVLTLSGTDTLANYEAALASVKYDNTSDTPDTATRTIAFQVNDGQGTDNLSAVASRTVTVAPTNDAPGISAGTTVSYTENAAATVIASTATVTDPDSTDFNGGSLTAAFTANGTAADQLSIVNQGTAAGQIGVSGSNVTYGGAVIGTFAGGTNGTDLVVTFNSASATPTAVEALARDIAFSNTSDSPSTAARTVTFTVVDGDGGSDTASTTATVNVTAVNDAPVLANGAGTALAYTENDAATAVNSGLTIADVDSANLTGATVTISANFQSGQDVLSFTPTGSVTGSFNASTGVLTLSGTDTVANYQAAIDSVKYVNTSENPSAATRTLSFQVDDGGAVDHASNVVTRDVSVTPVNDTPVITAGGTLGYVENDTAKVINNAITVTDAEGDSLTGAHVTISANFQSGQDVLSFTPTGNISGSFNATTGVLTLSGTDTAANYQAALQSVAYANTSDNPSTAARTISFDATDSHGDTGLAATSTVNVAAVNDLPVNTVPADSSIGTAFSNTAMSIAGVSIADVDAGSGTMTVHVSAASGGVTFSLAGGAAVSAGANGSADVTLSGTASQLNLALATLSYKSNDGFTGSDTITVTTDDGGNTGSGGAKADTDVFHVGVVPQVFIIDNSDTTSDALANAGSAANPYNSIASFNTNAVDGTGDYIYIKHGTGTYSEASGLTLNDNEQVYGEGQTLQFTNPVTGAVVTVGTGSAGNTPVLSITGASQAGVTLAQGNTLKGFDIATTLGNQTGMKDGGGTVGTLNVNDVNVTGSGMAVDIDQGGTLNVAIDKLTSTASAQQGVQLAGTSLSGWFSVADPTSAISGSSGTGFLVGDGSGTANTGGTFALDYAGTISTTGTARALDIEDRASGAGTVTLSGNISHTGGNANGIVIDDIAGGAITLSGNSNTLNTGTSTAVLITDVTGGGVTLSGDQDIDTTSGTGISLSGSSQAINFTGTQITVNTTSGTGISTANSGTTTFNNVGSGLDIVTNGGTGIVGTSGTLAITGSSNTISATNGTAVNLANTTIGASNLNFVSVASSNATNGIVLNNTGSTGSLVVTGSGSANSGGTISGATGDGISVTSGAVKLAYMIVQNAAGNGINLSNLLRTDNTFNNGTLTGFDNGGTNSEDGIHWVNTGANAGSLTVSGSTFTNGSNGNDAIFTEAQGSGAMTLTVSGSTFGGASASTGLFGEGVQVNAITGATSTVRVTIQNSTFQNALATTGNGGISLNPFGNVTYFADVNNNQFNSIMNPVANLGAIGITNSLGANADITIRNNVINNIAGARGITVTADGGTTDLLIDNNSIDNLGSTGKSAINVNFIDDSTHGTVGTGNVTVSNNQIGQHGSTAGNLWTAGTGSVNAILLQTLNGASMTAAIANNTVSANTLLEVVRVRAAASNSPSPPGGTINATVTGNTITDTSGTHLEFNATAGNSSINPGTVNLTVFGNTVPGSGVGVITLTENTLGTLNVTQGGTTGVSTVNSNATVTASGSPQYASSSPPTPSTPSLPLLASGTNDGSHQAHAITTQDIVATVAAAANRWAQLPLSQEQLQTLSNLTFAVGFLSGGEVGTQAAGLIVLDNDAAGLGWYVDATPMDDREFGGVGTLLHGNAGDAATQVDLLTAVMHEMGHALGLGDLYGAGDSADVMYGYIEAGVRRLPAEHDAGVMVVGTAFEGGGGV